MPRHIFFSGTGENEITSIFFVILFLLTTIIAFKENKSKAYILSAVCLAFACQIRIENIIFILVFILILLFNRKKVIWNQLLDGVFVFIILMIPLIPWYIGFQEIYQMLGNLFGKQIVVESVQTHFETSYGVYSIKNSFSQYFYWLIKTDNHNPIYLIFILVSFFFYKIRIKELTTLWSLFILYSLVYILYFTGYFFRYIVYLNAVIAIIVAYSIVKSVDLIKKKEIKKFALTTLIVLIFLTTLYFTYSTPLFDESTDVKDIVDFSKANPEKDIFLCWTPVSYFEFDKVNRIQLLKTSENSVYIESKTDVFGDCEWVNKTVYNNYNLSVIEKTDNIVVYDVI